MGRFDLKPTTTSFPNIETTNKSNQAQIKEEFKAKIENPHQSKQTV
jgi:hypothetical protein